MNEAKEEFNVCVETAKQRDMILNALSLSEKILKALRGEMLQEDCDIANDNCVLDTIKTNTRNLKDLERNLNEIIEKIMG